VTDVGTGVHGRIPGLADRPPPFGVTHAGSPDGVMNGTTFGHTLRADFRFSGVTISHCGSAGAEMERRMLKQDERHGTTLIARRLA
jgi:hypothetical protein